MHRAIELKDNLGLLQPLAKQLFSYWAARGGVVQELETFFQDKIPKLQDGKAIGRLVLHDDEPVAFGWVERVTPHYGNTVVYSINDNSKETLINSLFESGALSDILVELVQFEEGHSYQTQFLKLGLNEYFRQRMAYVFGESSLPDCSTPDSVSFRFLEETDLPWSAEVSYLAHQVSKDYEGYQDMGSLKNRDRLEKSAFNGIYGSVNHDASVVISDGGKDVGYVFVIDVPCWGFEAVPWVFDVCVHPDYIGKGYGTLLIAELISRVKDKHYPVIGLSVTKSNPAVRLYDRMGFRFIEDFYEYGHNPALITNGEA